MKNYKIYVLRLSHRPNRDKRVTTHLFLAARAFGANGASYTGQRDLKIENGVIKVNKSWGGSFELQYTQDWRKMTKAWKKRGGEIIHLTMYGLPVQDVIDEVKSSRKDKLIIVGGAKVSGEIYEMADWNIAVTSQPHSEVSALSIFLHMLFNGQELSKTFEKAAIQISPQARGKKIVKSDA